MGSLDPAIQRPPDMSDEMWRLARQEAAELASRAGSAAVATQVEQPTTSPPK